MLLDGRNADEIMADLLDGLANNDSDDEDEDNENDEDGNDSNDEEDNDDEEGNDDDEDEEGNDDDEDEEGNDDDDDEEGNDDEDDDIDNATAEAERMINELLENENNDDNDDNNDDEEDNGGNDNNDNNGSNNAVDNAVAEAERVMNDIIGIVDEEGDSTNDNNEADNDFAAAAGIFNDLLVAYGDSSDDDGAAADTDEVTDDDNIADNINNDSDNIVVDGDGAENNDADGENNDGDGGDDDLNANGDDGGLEGINENENDDEDEDNAENEDNIIDDDDNDNIGNNGDNNVGNDDNHISDNDFNDDDDSDHDEDVIRDLTTASGTDFVSDNIMIYKSLQIGLTLVNIHFSFLENISRSTLDSLPLLSNLRELKITYSDITTDILQCIGKCMQIETLIFENSSSIDLPCCEIISRLTQLKRFVLSKARRRPRISNQHLIKLTNLAELELNGCIIRDNINDLFASSLLHFTKLSLIDSEIYDDSLTKLHLKPQLTKLDLSYAFITNNSFATIGRLKLLQELVLSHSGFYDDDGIGHLRNLTFLKKLHLDHNRSITDRIFEILRDLPLEDFNLCANFKLFHGNSYVDLIFMTKLKSLDISEIRNVNDICLMFLSDMRLKRLIVSARKITESAISDYCKRADMKRNGEKYDKIIFTSTF